VLFVTCEVWINVLAPDAVRGRIIGIYTTVISAMFAIGPLLVPLIGYEGLRGFGTVAVLFLLLGLPVLRLRAAQTPAEKAPFSEYPRVVAAIPVLLMAVATFSFFDGAVLALWVVYGVGRELTASGAAMSLAVLVAGNIVLQYPIGWLADRMSRRLLLGLLSALAFAGGLLLPQLSLANPFTYVFLFFWGAIGFGVYTIAVTLIGQYLTGSRLVAANSAFGIMWGLGSMLGPVAAGAAMERYGGAGLPLSIAVAYGLLTLLAVAMPPIRESLRRLERQRH
jgi:MFS family permease